MKIETRIYNLGGAWWGRSRWPCPYNSRWHSLTPARSPSHDGSCMWSGSWCWLSMGAHLQLSATLQALVLLSLGLTQGCSALLTAWSLVQEWALEGSTSCLSLRPWPRHCQVSFLLCSFDHSYCRAHPDLKVKGNKGGGKMSENLCPLHFTPKASSSLWLSHSPDCRCRKRKVGGMWVAAGAGRCRVTDQQERGPPSVLRSTPGALAGTPSAPRRLQ
jgi:hypothetical protein